VPQYRLELAGSHNNLGNLLVVLGRRTEAEAAYRQALLLQEKLAADLPAVPQYRLELAGSQVNIGNLFRASKQPEQALQWYANAIAALDGVLSQVKIDVTTQNYLRVAHEGRAMALDDLKRHAEAAADWDKAVELSPKSEQAVLRMNRAVSRARAGQLDVAIQEAEELAKNANALVLYDAACVFALAADRTENPAGAPSKEECAQRAVTLLQQAVAKGFKDAEHMKTDDDLKALHQRDDFKKLVAGLEKQTSPKPAKP
jgi:tetratricopeptide (TPR) repeat protein